MPLWRRYSLIKRSIASFVCFCTTATNGKPRFAKAAPKSSQLPLWAVAKTTPLPNAKACSRCSAPVKEIQLSRGCFNKSGTRSTSINIGPKRTALARATRSASVWSTAKLSRMFSMAIFFLFCGVSFQATHPR